MEFVGVVPNSLQDIGRASDGAERRPVAGGLGRSVAESEAGPSGLAPVLGGCERRSPPREGSRWQLEGGVNSLF